MKTINIGNIALGSWIASIDCSSDSKFLAIGQYASGDLPTLSLLNLETGNVEKKIVLSKSGMNSVFKVKFMDDDTKLVYLEQPEIGQKLMECNLQTDENQELFYDKDDDSLGHDISTNKINNRIITGTTKLQLYQDELNNDFFEFLKKLDTFNDSTKVYTGCFSNDGNIIAIGGLKEGTIIFFNINECKIEKEFTAPFHYPSRICLSPDNRFMAVADFWEKGLFIWDLQHDQRYIDDLFDEEYQAVRCINFSPDSRYLAVGYSTSFVEVWDLYDPDAINPVIHDELHEERIFDILFTPDGNKLISAGEDGKIVVRELAMNK